MANTSWSTTDKSANITLSGSNLTATSSSAGTAVRAADRQLTGKFYWEVKLNSSSTLYGAGCANLNAPLSTMYSFPVGAAIVYTTGLIFVNNVNTGITLGSLSAGNVILCLALDMTNALFWARSGAAGNWNANASANPATGTLGINIAALGGNAIPLYPAACFGAGNNCTANFGDTAFTGTPPSGFTSGFTAGASITTSAVVTQTAVEEWVAGVPAVQVTQVGVEEWTQTVVPAQLTQMAVEQWAAVNTVNVQGVMTQIALEHWATVGAGALGGPMITTIM